ncbi:MAG TPA: acyl-ACP--UDP-N-acetylglucosamine O-acyltransferase [Candidatus Competibacter sp.]|nr:acyl-ACP--UDP-N-acetylglucosamine O-acyltransferase [Candidatus Competibacteraceae bacterium]HAO33083.1 acyl-[acyl-carrier-protein]--UDP-N-acetylglucosamine O-acyltransferase [Candidatus Competibacteraceae bacterium]HRE55259.1 acyl-ACP--UDP-N-acetylglucosamine O-acyltransferase [Candidatus Competibacter sp.]HUM94087.1 acyl-ACP--UDP-N-acetylglucosamine O-acyltransferase [Candidatus Competibacter sp.]
MIDPRAVVDPSARLASDVTVGPFSIIGAEVEIDAGTWIGPHVVIQGPTRIGRDNRIFQFASLGEMPQDKKYGGEPTRLEIGDRNTIREFVTINRGTVQDAACTRLGDDNWIMAYVHIAHDCWVGNRAIFANGASLAGHVRVEDDVGLGGFALVYQFTRLGMHSFCGFACGVHRDVPPYVTVAGYRAEPYGINAEGLRRRAFSDEEIKAIRRAYKVIYRANLRLEEAVEQVRAMTADWPRLQILADFLAAPSRNGIVR